jgi:hypothetical protein
MMARDVPGLMTLILLLILIYYTCLEVDELRGDGGLLERRVRTGEPAQLTHRARHRWPSQAGKLHGLYCDRVEVR